MVHGSKVPVSRLPSVDRCLRWPEVGLLLARYGHRFVADRTRDVIDRLRSELLAAGPTDQPDPSTFDDAAIVRSIDLQCRRDAAPSLRPVFNLTGTVLHTNLGRAVLATEALEHVVATQSGPSNLEFDLERGQRGDRDSMVEALICELTGAEAATIVNNNAAAVLLTIAALAPGREVIVSRGELVEIGGAFRMPDVMSSAGARLREVGTTNRTHAADYERAIGAETALIMKVHTSNYAIAGFTSAVDEPELVEIAHRHGVLFATDLGSGALIDLARYGLPHEPLVRASIEAGADVVTFSGDKLLGGPQAGIIAGRREAIERIRTFPMKRALRISKLPLAALEATLRLYRHPEHLVERLPTLRHLTRDTTSLRHTAEQLLNPLQDALGADWRATIVELKSQIGAGSLPIDRIESIGIAIAPVASKGVGRALERLNRSLLDLPVPVVARIADDQLKLDLRCLDDPAALLAQFEALATSLAATAST
jgi:L-seryl-tRNA(Ser) seleniumtransferase